MLVKLFSRDYDMSTALRGNTSELQIVPVGQILGKQEPYSQKRGVMQGKCILQTGSFVNCGDHTNTRRSGATYRRTDVWKTTYLPRIDHTHRILRSRPGSLAQSFLR